MADLLVEEVPAQAPTLRPDFMVFTGDVQVVKDAEELRTYTEDEAVLKSDRPRVGAIGSSNILDLQGDIMEMSALQDMTKAATGMLCFLNHSYNVPEDVAGSLADSPKISIQNHIADLHILVNMNMRNPRAVACYEQYQDGLRQGISGGFMIDDYELDDSDVNVRLHVLHVRALEFSFVGIPANPRSWVEYAARGLFTRTLDEKLAPIVKSLYSPRDYNEMLSGVSDLALRKHLAGIPARKPSTRRVFWVPERKTFALREQGSERDLPPEEVEVLLKEALAPTAPVVEPPEQKGASDEDKKAQEARASKYSIGIKEGGHITKPSEYADVDDDLFADPTNYRYPLDTKARADNAASRWGDESNRSQYSSKEQGIILRRIEARQRHFGEKPEKEDMAAPNATKALKINDDGTHDAPDEDMEHEHAHAGYGSAKAGDGQHSHSHPHKAGTADHDHHGSDGKQAQPEKAAAGCGCCGACIGAGCGCCAQCQAVDGKSAAPEKQAGVTINDDGTHAPWTGSHGHAHTDGDGGSHNHDHPHDGDADHSNHSHDGLDGKSALPEKAAALPESDRHQLIHMYEYAAGRLGLPDFKQACGLVSDAGQAQGMISLVSSLDLLDDQLTTMNGQRSGMIDSLLSLLNVPDMDGDSDGYDGADGYPLPAGYQMEQGYSVRELALCKALGFLSKAGARHSTADTALLQSIHDLTNKLGIACPPGYNGEDSKQSEPPGYDADAQARAEAVLAQEIQQSIIPTFSKSLDTFTRSIEGLNVAALREQVSEAQREIAAAKSAAETLQGQLKDLREVPLGRPTTFANRTIATDPAAVSFATLAGLKQESQANGLPEGVMDLYLEGVGYRRHWPAGVGGQVGSPNGRPALDPMVKAGMPMAEWMAYEDGKEAFVPILPNEQ